MYRMLIHASLVAALAMPVAVAVASAQPARSTGDPSLRFADGEWEVVRRIGLRTELFDQPSFIMVDDTRAVVFDFGTMTVKSVRLDGTVEWKSGRKGKGPGEYVAPTSLQMDSDGRIIVNDPDLARVTVLDRGGKVVATVPLASRFEIAIPGRTSAELLLLNPSGDDFVAATNMKSALRPVMAMPADLRAVASIARGIAGSVSNATGHLVAFRWSSRMMLLDGNGALVRSCMAVDSLPFPPPDKRKMTVEGIPVEVTRVKATERRAAVSVTTLGGMTAVLRHPGREGENGTVDMYAADCGAYRESRRLPVRASAIAGNGSVLVAVVMEPEPHLVVMRWK